MPESALPRLSRVDFFRLHEGDLIASLASAIASHASNDPKANLTSNHEAVLAWAQMSVDVPNGGFTQFFYNHRGDRGVGPLAALLDSLGVPKAGALLRDALAIYRQRKGDFLVDNPWEGLFGSIEEFDKIDSAFGNLVLRSNRALEEWIRSHIDELANDEGGRPIDSQFTGSVEVPQANGRLGEYLEVKNGKPHGAYREYFDDGSIRKVVFYKSGKVSGDFWPDGTLKRRESRRGPQTIIEWFYPSGKLQKRYVKGKSGEATEPIQLFYENGQLAEELHMVKGEESGPWLKFFEDGSPKLRAEHKSKKELIVHDAWNEDRVQVVKDGTGLFFEDGRRIDWEYSVFFEQSKWQHETELKGGIPHGKRITYHDGVLWRIWHYNNGVPEGESIRYWDNGRIKSIATLVGGKETVMESFPKFDKPTPAVVLSVEANEKLYTAWEHIRVDEYPRVLNLEEVQQQLKPPNFLLEVDERNRTGTIKSDYEDCNTFDDGIVYFLTVNEAGEVTRARANGSGAYSGRDWNTYPPFLLQLRFTPGRIRGRAVECGVLAKVDHTFVEGKLG